MPDIMLRLGTDVLVAEGAMGTMLQRYGMPAGACCEQLNEIDPETVEQVHRLYHVAGANCAITNTFGGTRAKLADYDLDMRADTLNKDGVKIARRSKPEHILASMGPCGLSLPPVGDSAFEANYAQYREQAASLAAADPDAIIIETMIDIADARCALLAAKEACDLPVFALCTFNEQGRMPISGTSPEDAALILQAAGADAVGLNCGIGPEQALGLMKRMAAVTSLPIVVEPNAGLPVRGKGGEVSYPGSADEFAMWAERFADEGAAIIGSCCGTTPAFTGAMAAMLVGRTVRPHGPAANGDAAAELCLVGPHGRAHIGGGGMPVVIARASVEVDASCANAADSARLADECCEDAVDALGEAIADAQDAGACATLVRIDAPKAAQLVASVAFAAATSAASPIGFFGMGLAALEQAVRVTPGRVLIAAPETCDQGDAEAACKGLLDIAAKYGCAVLVRVRDIGPEYDIGNISSFLERVRELAAAAGVSEESLLVDIATPRKGATSESLVLDVARLLEGLPCSVAFDMGLHSHAISGTDEDVRVLEALRDVRLDVILANVNDAEMCEAISRMVASWGAREKSEC